MIGGLTVKVCGLTRPEDVQRAVALGADYLGFILYPKSLRAVTLTAYAALRATLPAGAEGPQRVAVLVEPSLVELAAAQAAGFERFQIHARCELDLALVRAWSGRVGRSALWLAPKLPPGANFPPEWLEWADTFLLDTYHAEGFGGSGRIGDWAGFARWSALAPSAGWILAGGLGPDNIGAAIAQSGARWVDVNSGVERAPGVKDEGKMAAFAAALVARARPGADI
jgi:phosphoribosylanthranilate isomerase